MINFLSQHTVSGSTYGQAIISIIALVGVIALWVSLLKDGLEGEE